MMKPIRIAHDPEAEAVYIRYADAPRVRQESLNERYTLNVDYADDGTIVGIEVIGPRAEDLERLGRFAREHDLSVEGLFANA